MKNLFFCLIIVFAFASCEKESDENLNDFIIGTWIETERIHSALVIPEIQTFRLDGTYEIENSNFTQSEQCAPFNGTYEIVNMYLVQQFNNCSQTDTRLLNRLSKDKFSLGTKDGAYSEFTRQ